MPAPLWSRPLPPVLRGARAALVFLTRLPAGGFPYREADWRWATAWFPAVGALVGGAAALAFRAGRAAGPTAAAALAVIAALVLTGALHEDGLADTADALGGAADRERLFAILKDSRIGTYGAAALIMALLLRVALLTRLDDQAAAALVVAGAWSRVAPVWLMAALPYVTPAETAHSRSVVQACRLPAVIATLAATAITGVLFPWRHVLGMAAISAGITAGSGWRFAVRAGGVTGDFLGAAQQISECAVLLWLARAVSVRLG